MYKGLLLSLARGSVAGSGHFNDHAFVDGVSGKLFRFEDLVLIVGEMAKVVDSEPTNLDDNVVGDWTVAITKVKKFAEHWAR